MAVIAAYKGLNPAIDYVISKGQTYLEEKGVAVEQKTIKKEKAILMRIGSKNPRIRYWTATKKPPKDGRYRGRMNYFQVYTAIRNVGGQGRYVVLYLVA